MSEFELFLKENNIWHEFFQKSGVHSASGAMQAIGKYNLVKSLLFKEGDNFCLVILQGNRKVNAKKLRKLLGEENVRLASQQEVLEVTGYPVGAVPPIALKIKVKCILDKTVQNMDKAWAGGGSVDKLVYLKIGDIIKYHNPVIEDISE